MAVGTIFGRAADAWRAEGTPLLPPPDPGARFEALGRPLSADVRASYAAVGGFVDHGSATLFSPWGLDRMRAEDEAGGPLVLFADYRISSHRHGLRFESEHTSSVWVDEAEPPGGVRAASSVAESLGRLLDDPGSVWAWA